MGIFGSGTPKKPPKNPNPPKRPKPKTPPPPNRPKGK